MELICPSGVVMLSQGKEEPYFIYAHNPHLSSFFYQRIVTLHLSEMEAATQDDSWIVLVLGLGLLLPFLLQYCKTANKALISQDSQVKVQTWSTPRWLMRWQSLFKGRQLLDQAHHTVRCQDDS
jgi:hypothetical protein